MGIGSGMTSFIADSSYFNFAFMATILTKKEAARATPSFTDCSGSNYSE
jgi:hypothetical protein